MSDIGTAIGSFLRDVVQSTQIAKEMYNRKQLMQMQKEELNLRKKEFEQNIKELAFNKELALAQEARAQRQVELAQKQAEMEMAQQKELFPLQKQQIQTQINNLQLQGQSMLEELNNANLRKQALLKDIERLDTEIKRVQSDTERQNIENEKAKKTKDLEVINTQMANLQNVVKAYASAFAAAQETANTLGINIEIPREFYEQMEKLGLPIRLPQFGKPEEKRTPDVISNKQPIPSVTKEETPIETPAEGKPPVETPLQKPSQEISQPFVTEEKGYQEYIVQKGETPVKIAKKFGLTVQELLSLNKPEVDKKTGIAYFLEGQKIQIPVKKQAVPETSAQVSPIQPAVTGGPAINVPSASQVGTPSSNITSTGVVVSPTMDYNELPIAEVWNRSGGIEPRLSGILSGYHFVSPTYAYALATNYKYKDFNNYIKALNDAEQSGLDIFKTQQDKAKVTPLVYEKLSEYLKQAEESVNRKLPKPQTMTFEKKGASEYYEMFNDYLAKELGYRQYTVLSDVELSPQDKKVLVDLLDNKTHLSEVLQKYIDANREWMEARAQIPATRSSTEMERVKKNFATITEKVKNIQNELIEKYHINPLNDPDYFKDFAKLLLER